MGYESNVNDFKKVLAKNNLKFLTAVGILLKGQARLLAPVGDVYGGTLRQDVDYIVSEGFQSVQVGNRLDYALFVNKGTGIFAEDGDGRQDPWVYFDPKTGKYFLTHGQEPQPYIQQSITFSQKDISKLASKILGRIDPFG